MKFIGAHIFDYDATFRGDVTIEGNLSVSNSVSQTISFGDNDFLYFGDSNDLQIYHDGSNSYIKDAGTGDLYIQGESNVFLGSSSETYFKGIKDDAVLLYFNNAAKLATKTDGVNVVGELECDSLDVDGNSQLDGTLTVGVDDTGYDVKFYGDTASKYMLWDASADQLNVAGSATFSEQVSAGTHFKLQNGGKLYTNSSNVTLQSASGSYLGFNISTSEKMRLTSDGNLLLGTTTDSARLTVDETTTNNLTVAHLKHNQGGVLSNILLENSAGADNTGFDIDFRLASSGTSAKIGTIRTNSPGAGDTDMFFSTSTNGTSVAEAMRITHDANVGIGTSSPAQLLHVDGNARVDGDFFIIESNPQIFLSDTNHNSDFSISLNSGLLNINDTTNNSTRLTINSSGDVGIGTTSPASKLDVRGAVQVGVDDTGHDVIFYGATTGRYMQWDESADSLLLKDNVKLLFGNQPGGDLQIYHDTNNSYIDDAGTGSLNIRSNSIVAGKYTGEVLFRGTADGSFEAFYDNSVKLSTTNTGIDVSGDIEMGKSLTMAHISDASDPASGHSVMWSDTSGNLKIKINVAGSVVTRTLAAYED